ncbi:(2Fe-2S)-binding protein [Hydrogenimonas sp. SS33]|uniref:(2Fe-2S)-binding protein n=1 Tax=Hydrogenimonas leucolamina TaxID=2954236 RepID=UPI00336BCD3B
MPLRCITKKFDVTTLDDDDLICYCIGVDKKTIVEAIREGASDLKAVKEQTGACTGSECAEKNPNGRCCSKEIRQLIALVEKGA